MKVKLSIWFAALTIIVGGNTVHAAVGDLTVSVPKTAYIQWLANATDSMTSVDGDASFAFDPYVGGAVTQLTNPTSKVMYFGVMCNSLAGYDVTFSAGAGATASTGEMTQAGAANISFTVTLGKDNSTFAGGATASTSLDLTGATPSATAVFAAEADLPMAAAAPNIWTLSANLPVITTVADGLIMSGNYAGSITSTIALK